MKVAIVDNFSPGLESRIKSSGYESHPLAEDTEAVLVRSRTKVDKSFIDSCPNLKLIIRGGVGLDNVDMNYAGEKGIAVKNTPKASAVAVAELAFAHLISIPSLLIDAHNSMKEGKWLKKTLKRTELYEKTICLVGMGNIGFEMAKRCHAFGMKVKTYTVDGNPGEYALLMPDLESAVKDADYISLHIPLTKSTENLINREIISFMKDGAAIINTSRGKCVNSEDIRNALKEGKISYYASDVWETEPPSEDTPLYRDDRVIMTPHIGASTGENLERIETEIINILDKYNNGEK